MKKWGTEQKGSAYVLVQKLEEVGWHTLFDKRKYFKDFFKNISAKGNRYTISQDAALWLSNICPFVLGKLREGILNDKDKQ